jgi:hypothetical protein
MPNAPRIELPRPAMIAAIGALLLAATFLVTKGSEGGSLSSSPSNPTTTDPAQTTPTPTTTDTGTTTTPAVPKEPPVQAGQGLPSDIARALDRHDVVVLFFYEPAAADDQATRAAIRAVRGVPKARLFSDTVAHISSYRRLVGTLNISQSPAMVVIDKQRKAHLFEGFLDAGSIRQSVRDAL